MLRGHISSFCRVLAWPTTTVGSPTDKWHLRNSGTSWGPWSLAGKCRQQLLPHPGPQREKLWNWEA
jgi:hypothetical protein